ncbi:MAG: Uncharacterized protein LiPW39_502 [Parcubacteria group bacterium LiPW_39]|nr:MAG: Uncharacterized protein LiPW39_502 [Parcubacteria group bacterium LiPW_39]
MNFSFLNNFSWAGSSAWIMLLIFLAVAFVYGLSMGRSRLVVVTLGTYFSYILTRAIPWQELAFLGVKQAPSSTSQIFIFLALILGFYFLIPHSALRSVIKVQGRRRSAWWHALILSVLQIGLILQMVISFLPNKVVTGLSPLAQLVFSGQLAQFCWLLLPILAIMFLRTRQYDVGGE